MYNNRKPTAVEPPTVRAIAILRAAEPLGDAAVPVLEAAGKCDRERCLKFLEHIPEDEDVTDEKGRRVYPLMQLRALVEALPAKVKT